MNPNKFNIKNYGFNTNDIVKTPKIHDGEMKLIVDNVLYKMNTQPHEVSFNTTVPPVPTKYIKSPLLILLSL